MPRSFLSLNSLRQHKAEYQGVFTGLRISVEAWAAPGAIYDRSLEELVLVISGRPNTGAALYRQREAGMKIGDGVMLRFPDATLPIHVRQALYGDARCEWEVIEMHRLCMKLAELSVESHEAVAIYDALNEPSKTIIDAVTAQRLTV